MMKIRREREKDREQVGTLLREAFDGDEDALVARIRSSAEWIPELTFVAEENGGIIGHIMASRCLIDDTPMIALAPLAVLPGHQRKGVGHQLVNRLIEQARERTEPGVVVLGHPAYYEKFGFEVASRYGIVAPFKCPDEAYRVKWMGDQQVAGVVAYGPAFD